jgi:hypothetical protein
MFPIQGRSHLAFLFDLACDHTCEIALTPLTPPCFVQLRNHSQKQAESTVIRTRNQIKIRSQRTQSLCVQHCAVSHSFSWPNAPFPFSRPSIIISAANVFFVLKIPPRIVKGLWEMGSVAWYDSEGHERVIHGCALFIYELINQRTKATQFTCEPKSSAFWNV